MFCFALSIYISSVANPEQRVIFVSRFVGGRKFICLKVCCGGLDTKKCPSLWNVFSFFHIVRVYTLIEVI